MGQYMLFIGIALTMNEYYSFRDSLRIEYALKDYIKSLSTTPEVPALITQARDSFNYGNQPLKEVQNRRKFNHNARKSQAGLEMRMEHKRLKEETKKNEREIQDAFGRKLKSHRWMKRHHVQSYDVEEEGFPFVY